MKGIVKISNADYHNGSGLSSSGIKELIKSAAHYKAWAAEPKDQTAEMLKGSLVHSLILEPEKFAAEYHIGDFKIRRGKEFDAAKREADNFNRTLVSVQEHNEAVEIATAFFRQAEANPELKALLKGAKETAFYWEDKDTGILCKVKPDILLDAGGIVDIKTARSATFDALLQAMIDLLYFVSAAFYLRGVNEVLEAGPNYGIVPPKTFTFVVIETKAPYAVAIYKLEPAAIEFGNTLVNAALNTYSLAVATDTWEGYPKKAIPMGLPNYAMYKHNYLLGSKE